MTSIDVTADDFGLAREVNEAVEIAHVDGILTSASLMVGAPHAADAVARARRLPALRVGLHLVLVDGRPLLPPERIPDLVDGAGCFRNDLTRLGIAIFLRPSVRRQVAAEIEAQFAAFDATGLVLDHVNAHQHYHLHPTIAGLLIEIGRRHGMRAVRVPAEPATQVRTIDPTTRSQPALWPYTALLRRRLRRAGIATADRVYGYAWSGHLHGARLAAVLRDLPPGHSEIYLHPATANDFPGACPGYEYAREFEALTSAATRAAWHDAKARHRVDGIAPIGGRAFS